VRTKIYIQKRHQSNVVGKPQMHSQSQYQQSSISYEELAICNKQTSNREEMAAFTTSISYQGQQSTIAIYY
jgi:hypothetical protein